MRFRRNLTHGHFPQVIRLGNAKSRCFALVRVDSFTENKQP